jgi:hypothetical protein
MMMSPEDILPDVPTQATPTQLAESIRTDLEAISSADQDKLARAFAAGTKLRKARGLVERNKWLTWLRENCCAMKPRTAQDYMRLARDRAVIDAHNDALTSAHERINSIEAALKFLRGPPHNGATPPARHARTSAHEPAKSAPLTSLSWMDMTPEQRRKLLDGVPVETFLDAMPQSWRDLTKTRVIGHLSSQELVETLERKLKDKPAARKVLKALQKELEPAAKPISTVIGKDDSLDIPTFLRRDPVGAGAGVTP